MFKKILIANRGEIACRIQRTAQELGIHTVAIYSEPDVNALHVKLSQEAYCVGPAQSKDSYLNGDKIIAIARKAHVDAIHPGYGFLAENSTFATSCEEAKIVFIGPSPQAIRAMGSKSVAKKWMEEAQIPLIPGYHGEHQDEKFLLAEAQKIGFPVILKASAGGGGKGMRIVEQREEFHEALLASKREAKSSFGDEHMILEKYIYSPRHIEFQIFADHYGNYVHLFERDCSIQRRHQKIIEEAPASHLTEKTRKEMAKAAIKVAKAIAYRGAGTIEFLVDEEENFYFMEMNTRLQVEHPITEMITGFDLVEWQFRVAMGEKLPVHQDQIKMKGHAIEARIYAEDPENQFLPSCGEIFYLKEPSFMKNIRVDSGIMTGDTILPYYDPMLAKVIAWDEDRQTAIAKLQGALASYHLVGPETNIQYLQAILKQPDFMGGKISTHFIPTHSIELKETLAPLPDTVLILACLYHIQQRQSIPQNVYKSDPYSPWNQTSGWQLNLPQQNSILWHDERQSYPCSVSYLGDRYYISVHDKSYQCHASFHHPILTAAINGEVLQATLIFQNNHLHIFQHQNHFKLALDNPIDRYKTVQETSPSLNAPMPGTIVSIHVKAGEQVTQGDKLMALEAMKMEHTIYAPYSGRIKAIHYAVGDMVDEGTILISFANNKS